MRLVADANVLLSAATGGRATLMLARPDLAEIVTTASAMAEVQEYAEPLARKVGLPLPTVWLAIATLPVLVIDREEYSGSLPEARRRIGRRDPTTPTFWRLRSIWTSEFGRTTVTSLSPASNGTRPRNY